MHPKFDRAAIRAHCSHLHHAAARANVLGGKICLAVYGENPDTGERIASVQHFDIGDHEPMADAALEYAAVLHANVYCPLAVFKSGTEAGTRVEKDIAAVFGFVIDGDADKGKDAPTPPLPADYVIESSAGNLQHFLFLDRPLPPDEAKAFGNALKRATGADAANDIGHVWRVPGCLNWPNASKLKRGRSREPQPVIVKQPWTKWTNLAELRTTLEPHWEAPRERKEGVASRGEACPNNTRRVLDWLIENDAIKGDEAWRRVGMALRDEFGDDPGLGLFSRICHGRTVDTSALKRWNSYKPSEGDGIGIGTLRKLASDAGCPHRIGRSVESMFEGVDAKLADAPLLAPQPFIWRDPKTLPKMQFIYGDRLLRGTVYLTVAAPGVGKTFRKIGDALAMATGRTLLHEDPKGKLKVWLTNGEEPMDILERRILAAMMAHHITPDALAGRLFVNDRTSKFVIARQTKDGVVQTPVRDAMISYIRENQIDVVIVDPFIGAHAVSENDNNAIDQVVKLYADIAQETNCVIDLVHHARKTNGEPVTFEDARGASAAGGAVRGGDVMNVMSKDEAKLAGVEEEHRKRYVKIGDGKENHAPNSRVNKWLKFESVYLGNGEHYLDRGDSIGVLKRWHWPDHRADATPEALAKVQEAVAGGEWRDDVRCGDNWVGKAIGDALGLDREKAADLAKVKALLRQWLKDGHLVVVERKDEHRKEKKFVEVGKAPVQA